MNKKIMGVLLATTMLLGIFTGCKKEEIKPSCPVDHLTVQYSGACLYNEEQYSIYSIIAPYEYEIIYENTVSFIVRFYCPVEDTMRIKYQDKLYRIISINPDRDLYRNKTIITELINE